MPFELYMQLRKVYFGQDYVNRAKHINHSGYLDATSLEPPQPTETDEHFQLKSFLNVIADSGVVETYLLTKAEMQYLPDSELKIIFDWFA